MYTIKEIYQNKVPMLAPMAGVSDRSYRIICRKFGAGTLFSEMVSAKGVCYQNTKTEELCTITDYERPMGIQLFGAEPEFMGRAAEILMKFNPDFFDINMGCPVQKVVKTGAGSALLNTPDIAEKIVEAVKKAVSVPVSVKMRIGYDDENIVAVPFAKRLESAGCDAVIVHGRTKKQLYSGKADIYEIAKVKDALTIPVIGNGDITDTDSALKMYNDTNCDSIMIGRATYGNPWIFREISNYFNNKEYTPPTIKDKMDVMLEHIRLVLENSPKAENLAIREVRKNAAWYISGVRNAAKMRNLCYNLNSYSDAENLAKYIIAENNN